MKRQKQPKVADSPGKNTNQQKKRETESPINRIQNWEKKNRNTEGEAQR